MTSQTQSRSVLYTAPSLSIGISLTAIIWRSYFAEKLKLIPTDDWDKDKTFLGLVVFLLGSLLNHVVWLISSVVLLIWGQKGNRVVMYVWISVTWLSILIDTGFFGYFAHNFMLKGNFAMSAQKEEVNIAIRLLLEIGIFFMLLLLIHILLAYLTIQVWYYAVKLVPEKSIAEVSGYSGGHVLSSAQQQQESDPYFERNILAQQSALSNQAYQNIGYSRSTDDVRYGVGGFNDKAIGNRLRRYAAPEEIPPPDYRRVSRGNTDGFRY